MIGLSFTAPHPYNEFTDNDIINFSGTSIKVLHTPGHTRGGVSLFLNGAQNQGPVLFSGDTLFRGDVGRCDLPGGDWETLRQSIIKKLYGLPDDTVVYPGHGPPTTIGNEKLTNNYVRAV